jgi:hypothetical protein
MTVCEHDSGAPPQTRAIPREESSIRIATGTQEL